MNDFCRCWCIIWKWYYNIRIKLTNMWDSTGSYESALLWDRNILSLRFPHAGWLSAGFAGLQQAWHEEGGAGGHNFPFPRRGQNTARVTHKHPKISIEAPRPVTGLGSDPTDTRRHKLCPKNHPSLRSSENWTGWLAVDKKGRWALGCLEWGGSRVYLRDRRWHESSQPPHTPPHGHRADWRCQPDWEKWGSDQCQSGNISKSCNQRNPLDSH